MDYIEAKTNERIILPQNQYKKDFYEFTTEDLHVEDYEAGPQIRNIPVAHAISTTAP